MTQKQLAIAIGTTEVSIYSWEKGRAEPSIDYLIRLATFFGCTLDYLAGLSEFS